MPKDEFEHLEDMEKEFEATSRTLEGVAGKHDEALDFQAKIELKDEGVKAYLILTSPKLGGKPPEIEKVLGQIKQKSILEFDERVIHQAIENKEFEKPILIAQGQAPSRGKDARIIIQAKNGDMVENGQVLAIKEAAGKGSAGKDVCGREIPGLLGEDAQITAGPGVRLEEDGTRASAEVEGRVSWVGDTVEVKQEEASRLSQEEMADIEETVVKMRRAGQDGKAEVTLDEGGLKAYLTITPPQLDGKPLNSREAMDALASEGVVNVDEERIKKALRDEEFNQPILVVEGIPPIKGADAYLTNRVEAGENVTPQQLLVVKVLPAQGRPGRSVKGEVVPGLLGDDIIVIAGENVEMSDDGLRAYAADYGEVEWEENEVKVKAVSADQETGFEDMERELEVLAKSLKGMKATSSNLDGWVKVSLSEDKSEAYIILIPPQIGGEPVEIEQVLAALKEKGVMDVDSEVVSKAVKGHEFNKKILIANGVAPTRGEDAYFVYRFGVDEEENVLGERAVPGQLLVIKVPAIRGSSGKAVTGEKIPGQFGEQLDIQPGIGVIFSDDRTRAYATRMGQVIWEEGRLSVEEVREVNGDLTPEEGDLSFTGKIVINGAVSDKVTVKSQSDIVVHGGVGDATLISGGSIRVDQAIFGKGEGKIMARGNVSVNSAEGMLIEVDGNLFIEDFLRKCKVSARRIICGGRIEGGKLSAHELIEAKNLGSEAKTKTTLKVERGGKISSSEAIHPGVELKMADSALDIKNPKQGLSFRLEGSQIKEGPYIKAEVEEGPLVSRGEAVELSDLVLSVVVDCTSLEEGRKKGAEFLDLSETEIDTQEISEDEDKETIKIRVFPAGVSGPWDMEDEIDKELGELLGEGDTDGHYRLANMEDGLFLTVFPPERDGSVVGVGDVLKEIETAGFKDIDEEALKTVVDQSLAAPVKIAPRQHIAELDGVAMVEISGGKTKAELTLVPPQPGGLPASFEDAIEALEDKGIVAGIKEEIIKEAIREAKHGTPLVVAEELPPTPGQGYRIEYHFDITPPRAKFTEDEWGRVDFKELDLIQGVKAGQVLATKTGSPILGQPGQRITGEEIPPPPIEDVKLPAGKNTEISEDGSQLGATINGHVAFVNERINVEPMYEVKGDVNLTTGNIDFSGTVDIAGNVEDGFKVRADGDIQVRGGVGKAILSAGGSINIGHGIQANREGRIWAGKDIICKFVEMGDLFARGDIIIGEEVLHSELNAGGNIIVTGKRGLVIGGTTRAQDEVTAKAIGCELNTPTIIEVGAPPKIREQISALRELLNEDLKEFEQVKFNVMNLKHQRETKDFSPEREELLIQLINTQSILLARLRSYTQRKEALEKDLAKSTGGVVNVLEVACSAVVIVIRNTIFEVMEKMESVTFFLEGKQIRYKSYGGRAEEGAGG